MDKHYITDEIKCEGMYEGKKYIISSIFKEESESSPVVGYCICFKTCYVIYKFEVCDLEKAVEKFIEMEGKL